jgi:penicillin-binding protein A
MIGFFVKRPALGVLALLAVGISGGVIAHRRGPVATRTAHGVAALSMTKRPAFSTAPAVTDWRARLDLDKARWQGKTLVQDLGDGGRVTFSIDSKLQKWAGEYLKSYQVPYGGMVMFDLRTSKVLVMAGHSADNPKVSTRELCLTPWAPAASVYKLVTAAALLDHGVSPETNVCYHGGFHGLRKHHVVDDAKLDKDCNTLTYAIAKSINPIMAKLALKHLTDKDMEDWSYRFGFNRPIPFELPVQPSKASIPTEDLARAKVAAGFWKTEASVLHGALMAAVAASRGLLVWPSLVESVKLSDGRILRPEPPEPERVMGRGQADKLASMMLATTKVGTGVRAFHDRSGNPFLPKVEVGGKTGSLSRQNPFLHYSWFVGFAPVHKPRVAFAVLLGNPAKWTVKANVAARVLLTHYFNPDADKAKPRPAPAGAPSKGIARAKGKSKKIKHAKKPAVAERKISNTPRS